MKKFTRAAVGVVAATTLLVAGATSSSAASNTDPTTSAPRASSPQTIGARTYGPDDGLTITIEQIPITPGGGPVGVVFGGPATTAATGGHLLGGGVVTPQATWGSSYATSSETAQIYYSGTAYAAANVYSGKRIIQVCIWYSRGGVDVSRHACSTANSTGSAWQPGARAYASAYDSLDPNAPQTLFNIQTSRIDPRVY